MRFVFPILFLLILPELVIANQLWKSLGEWTIQVKTDDASRCFASRKLGDGSEVQLGAEPTLDGGFFAIYNSDWTHISDGVTGEVEFDFGRSRFGGAALGKIENGMPGGYVFFNNPAFVQEFARRQTVRIIGSGGAQFELDLTGTSRAIREVLACQDAQPVPVNSE
ncbi:MAG: hypothetical protein R8G34_02500 [Paracoccaceae bacterium]|nr:hypothetical protein [Paracoccaceae bacterium]